MDDAKERAAWMARLCRAYGETDSARAVLYMEETREIPLSILRHACKLVIRSRVYPSLPSIGELWQAAHQVAGMHREQFSADGGRYVPPPRDWPPEGKRHAIHAGRYEPLAACEKLLPAGRAVPALGAGEG